MKTVPIILVVALMAGAASAGIVWTENWDADTLFDPGPNPVPMIPERDDTWLEGGAAVWNGGELRHLTAGSGQNRGVAIALTSESLSGVLDNVYTFAFDIVSMYAQCTMQVSIYEGIREGTTSANTYNLDLLSANNAPLVHTTSGTGQLVPLASDTYVQADVGAGKQVNFNWDGNDDLVIVFDMPASAAFTQRAVLDNMVLSVVPEPATLSLFALLGAVMFATRRGTSRVH